MAVAEGQKILCPVCHRADQVQKLQAAYEAGKSRFAPPPMPVKRVSMMRNMAIGMLVVGICIFFILILIGSGSFGPDFSIAELVLVVVTLVGIILALVLSFLAFQRVVQGDLASQKEYPAWDHAMENWNRLYYCSRDNVAFDPQTNKPLSEGALAALLSTEEKRTQGKPASAAH